MYVPIREPTDWELENLPCLTLTNDATWDSNLINDDLEGEVVFPDKDDIINNDMKSYVFQAYWDHNESGEVIPQDDIDDILQFINSLWQDAQTTTEPDTDHSKFQANLE